MPKAPTTAAVTTAGMKESDEESSPWTEQVNGMVAKSAVGRYFKLQERRTTFTQELRAGTVAFLASAYILAVNANILTQTGGTCSVHDCTGEDRSPACMFSGTDPGYEECLINLKKSFITATALSSFLACLAMGGFANMPLTLAPAMGVNAFFAFTVVGFRGKGNVTFEQAMAGVFVEGWIFLLLAVVGIRTRLISLIPRTIMLATAGGIGMFLALIGYSAASGLGVIAFNGDNYVKLGGCPRANQVQLYAIADKSAVCPSAGGPPNLPQASLIYQCVGGEMRSATLWLGIAGAGIMVFLLCRQTKGAMMIGILFVTIISWIYVPGNKATYLGKYSSIAGGEKRLEFFKKVMDRPHLEKTFVAWDWSGFKSSELWLALITWLYINLLDVTGTLFSMATFINSTVPGFVDEENGSFPGQMVAYLVDGGSIILGSVFGTPPLTIYIESATAIKEGGRTGISAIATSFFFFLALFFAPILASIPPYATGPALILVGALMMENCMRISWHDPMQAIPAFLTITLMPLTSSVTNGIIAGLGSYLFLHGATFLVEMFSFLVCGRGAAQSETTSVAGESEVERSSDAVSP